MPQRLAQLLNCVKDWMGEKASYIKFDKQIMGDDISLPIFKEDIKQFCFMQDIGSSAITIYFRYDYVFFL